MSPGRHRLTVKCPRWTKVYAVRVFRTEPAELVCILTQETPESAQRGVFREIAFDVVYPCELAFYIEGVALDRPDGHDELSFVFDGAGPFFDTLLSLDGEVDKGQPYPITFDVPAVEAGIRRLSLLTSGSPEWWGVLVWRKTVWGR